MSIQKQRSLELPRVAVDGILIHDAVVHHDRQAVSSLGNVLCLEEARAVCACTGMDFAVEAVIAAKAAERRRSRFVNI
jgi:hypothetical protein